MFRCLAHGLSFRALATEFHLHQATVRKIVFELCTTVWAALKDDYLPVPNAETWTRNAEGFEETWDFPYTLGAIDGKHFECEVFLKIRRRMYILQCLEADQDRVTVLQLERLFFDQSARRRGSRVSFSANRPWRTRSAERQWPFRNFPG